MGQHEVTGSIQVKKLKSGKSMLYCVLNTRDENNQFKQVWKGTGLTKKGNIKIAEEILRREIDSYNRKANKKEVKNILFCDWLKQVIESKERTIRASTYEAYLYSMKKPYDYFKKKNIKLLDMNYKIIDDFCKFMLKEGKVSQKDESRAPLSVRTVRGQKFLIGMALDEAVKREYIKINPASYVKASSKSNKEFKRMKALSKEQADGYIKFLYENDDVLAELIEVTLFLGLRRSEVLGLRIEDLDIPNQKLRIMNTVTCIKERHEEEKTKTYSSNREYPLTPHMIQLFQNVLNKKKENETFYGNTYVKSNKIFTQPDGNEFRPDFIYHHFKRTIKKYNSELSTMTFHGLRHTCATILLESGWNPKEVSEWLGHSDVSISLNIYSHPSYEHMKKKAKELEGSTGN